MFGLLLTSLKGFLWGWGESVTYACVRVCHMGFKNLFYMWYPQNISLLVNVIVEILILYR